MELERRSTAVVRGKRSTNARVDAKFKLTIALEARTHAARRLGYLLWWDLLALTPLVACGGLLAQDEFGWLAVVCCAATYHLTIVILMPHVVSCHRHMHTEARRILSVKKPDACKIREMRV